MIYDNIINQKEKVDTNKVLKGKIEENIQYEKSKLPLPFDPKGLLEKGQREKVQKVSVGQSVSKFEQVKQIYDRSTH